MDYYLLHTGRTEWSILKDPKEEAPPLHFLRLSQPLDIITCTDCYADPRIRKRLEDDFRGLGSILDEERAGGSEKSPVPDSGHG